jgi:hypothetical protein
MISVVMNSPSADSTSPAVALMAGAAVFTVVCSTRAWQLWQRRCEHRDRERLGRIGFNCQRLGWNFEQSGVWVRLRGRSLSQRWQLVARTDAARGAVVFTLGSPDLAQALALVCARPARLQASLEEPAFVRDTAVHAIGGRALALRFSIYARDRSEAQRLLSPRIERLLMVWPRRLRRRVDPSLRIWVCPHGIQLMSHGDALDWNGLRHWIQIGLAIGQRSGFP